MLEHKNLCLGTYVFSSARGMAILQRLEELHIGVITVEREHTTGRTLTVSLDTLETMIKIMSHLSIYKTEDAKTSEFERSHVFEMYKTDDHDRLYHVANKMVSVSRGGCKPNNVNLYDAITPTWCNNEITLSGADMTVLLGTMDALAEVIHEI